MVRPSNFSTDCRRRRTADELQVTSLLTKPGSRVFQRTDREAQMRITRVRGRKNSQAVCSFFVAGTLAVFTWWLAALAASAQTQTLFTDNFEDGDAKGWTKSGGTWTVVTDGSRVYKQSSTSSDARARAG